jgi:hypothetical protein
MQLVELQDRCRTRDIIVDGKGILIGGHKWTNHGTFVNRDASSIVHDMAVAAFA